jgi:hypothetical protein
MDIELLAPDAPPHHRSRAVRATRAAALLVVVALAALMVWTTPHEAPEGALAAALSHGQVAAVVVDDGQKLGLEQPAGVQLVLGRSGVTSSSSSGTIPRVIWATTAGRTYRTTLVAVSLTVDPAPPVADDGAEATDPTRPSLPLDLPGTMRATAEGARVPAPDTDSLGWPALVPGAASVVALLALLVLVLGPQPRRLTKWGVFWVLGVPGLAGIAWWLVREAPWSPQMSALAEPAPRAVGGFLGISRRSGGTGFLALLGATVVVSLVLLALSAALPVPASVPGSTTWTVVRADGSSSTLHM